MASAGEERTGPLTLGVMGRSSKENEHRLALHPEHLTRIPADLRSRIYLEHGYGERFGVSVDAFDGLVAGLRTREELIAECDVILQPKPMLDDIEQLRDGQVLWGWPHCVQDEELTQVAIASKAMSVSFRSMATWVSCSSCTQCGQPHSTCPSRISARS